MITSALPLPPPSLATDRRLPVVKIAARQLFRISPFPDNEPFFGCTGANRFDAPGCVGGSPEFRTCYFGLSLEVAIAESLLHDEIAVDGTFHISTAAIERRYLHRFAGKALRVFALNGVNLKRLGGHAGLAGAEGYAVTQQWSLSVFQNPLIFDGFIYMSRHLNTGQAVVLFDRAAKQLHAKRSPASLLDLPGFAAAATAFNITAI